jgi:hypothetical protein
LIVLVNLVNNGGAHEFIQEDMCNPAEVALVEAKDALFMQALDAFPIRLVDGRTVYFVEADLA